MAQLAILGHATRGKEVIEILEMLGGSNPHGYSADSDVLCFYICKCTNTIYYCWVNNCYDDEDVTIFTLEEFLERFPYKVRDKVQQKGATSCGSVFEVEKMQWEDGKVKYILKLFGDRQPIFSAWQEYLQPYKEETMEEKSVNHVYSISKCKTTGQGTYAIKIADGYKFDSIDENGNIIVKPIKPQYPKTYVECAKILECFSAYNIDGYKNELLEKLQELLICRDAYWKIAGNWKPNLGETFIYAIGACYGVVEKRMVTGGSGILLFPTEEMRDAFFENFKDLIEKCKEFL